MLEENETQETSLQDLIDLVERDDLPTNEFTTEDKDPMVILGKLNEVIAYLQTLQATINASDSKANEALQRAIQAVADATQALSVANGIDAKATQALANAIEAVGTANTALSASNTALSTANTAISTANTALSSANSAVETAEDALDTAESAETKADTAITTANGAKTTAEGIDAKATTALSNSQTAVSTANTAETIAQEALDQVVAGLGTKIYRGSQLLSSLDIKPIEDDIADNTTAITALQTRATNIETKNTEQDTAITSLQNGKVDKVTGKQLSTEDFTTALLNKLNGLNNYDDTQIRADIANKLSLSGGTISGNIFFNKGNGVRFNTNGNYRYDLYGDGGSTNDLYLQLKDANDNYNYYKLIDTNGKLYSNNKEVAKLTDSNQSITAGTMTAPTGNFDNINTSFSNFNTLLGQKLQIDSSNLGDTTGYIKFTNGLAIAWGNTGTSSGTITCNFGMAFKTSSSYSLAMCAVCGGSNATATLSYRQQSFNKNTTYFQTYKQNDIINGSDWVAIGKWK